MKKKRRKAVPNPARQKAAHSGVWKEYATAVAILLAGLVISVLILRRPPFLFHHVSDDGPVLTQKTADDGNPEGIPDSPTTYTVNFYDNDGIRIASRRVTGGDPILPPALTDEAAVFKGWSRPLYSIEEDMNVYPSFQFFDSAKNAVCADAVYADVKDEFAVTVRISGEVACCAFQIDAAYDGDLLRLTKTSILTDRLTVEHREDEHTLTLRLEGAAQMDRPALLAEFHFIARKKGSYQTNLPLQTTEIYQLKDGERIYTDSTAYDGMIYLLDVH